MINQEEYEILKKCDDKFKWVARDKNTELWVYTKKPYKGMYRWDSVGNINLLPRRSKYLLQFIQWDNEEPYRISDLIKEYEKNQAYEKIKETEVKKDKEWAFIELGKLFPSHAEMNDYPDNITVTKCELLNKVYDILSQLDEPEVLSQEWIDEHKFNIDTYDEVINVDDLQNLFVHKQDLPVIPKFVADWIEDLKSKKINLLEGMYVFTHGEDTHDYMREQSDVLMRAWIDGYTVEKEQKYYAKIKGHELVNDSEDGYWNVDGNELYIDNNWHDYSGYKTTKLTKYDWNNLGINDDNADFVKVEELKE